MTSPGPVTPHPDEQLLVKVLDVLGWPAYVQPGDPPEANVYVPMLRDTARELIDLVRAGERTRIADAIEAHWNEENFGGPDYYDGLNDAARIARGEQQ